MERIAFHFVYFIVYYQYFRLLLSQMVGGDPWLPALLHTHTIYYSLFMCMWTYERQRLSLRVVVFLKIFIICGRKSQLLSHVQLFMTPWTVGHQAPLSNYYYYFNQYSSYFNYYYNCSANKQIVQLISTQFQRRQQLLLQQIFRTQGSNSGLLHCRQILYCLSHLLANSHLSLIFSLGKGGQNCKNAKSKLLNKIIFSYI